MRLDFWDDSIVEFMTRNGNLRVKAKYEARVPAFYYVPQANDCLVLKEQWIRAKYERQEFMADGKIISPPGNREGFLWKRGRDNAQFLRRRFVLLAREGLLKYYTKEEGKDPKAVISIKDLNATFQTEKIGNPHGLQITYRREGHVRNLFVYHESGKEIVDWFNALRAARLQYLKMAFPELPESELVPLITRNYLKQGFMEKTGPKQREPFKKRWFALDPQERRLLYYKNPLVRATVGHSAPAAPDVARDHGEAMVLTERPSKGHTSTFAVSKSFLGPKLGSPSPSGSPFCVSQVLQM